jgi:predicted SAM-dependent methyltransferase
MKKIQFCSGNNVLIDWENYDKQIDISKPLPFDNNSIDFIFLEHGLEHITQIEGIDFLKECYRILKINGVMRIAFPDIEKIYKENDKIYN